MPHDGGYFRAFSGLIERIRVVAVVSLPLGCHGLGVEGSRRRCHGDHRRPSCLGPRSARAPRHLSGYPKGSRRRTSLITIQAALAVLVNVVFSLHMSSRYGPPTALNPLRRRAWPSPMRGRHVRFSAAVTIRGNIVTTCWSSGAEDAYSVPSAQRTASCLALRHRPRAPEANGLARHFLHADTPALCQPRMNQNECRTSSHASGKK